VHVEDADGDTALAWAADRGQEKIVRALLKSLANTEAVDKAFLRAASGTTDGHRMIVRLLLKKEFELKQITFRTPDFVNNNQRVTN